MDYFTVPIICIIILVVAAIIYFFPKLKEYPFFPFCTNEEDERYDPSVDKPVVGPDGERIIASAGPAPEPLPKPNDNIKLVERSPGIAMRLCGHKGPKWYRLNMYGLKSSKIDDKECCPECFIKKLRKEVTRCSLCGLPIFPGDAVALYHESSGGLKYKDASVRVGESYIGCMRWDCYPSGGFFAGHWSEDGFQSAFGHLGTATSEAMRTGQPVIRNI